MNKNKTVNPTRERIKITKCRAYSSLINLIATSFVEKQNTAITALTDPNTVVFPWIIDFIAVLDQNFTQASRTEAT